MAPVAAALTDLLGQPVRLARDWIDGVDCAPGEIVLGENVRFLVGEEKDDEGLARRMAALCDVYVNDAFATAHRAQASTHGVARYAPVACAGPLMKAEIDALKQALQAPKRPLVAIVGGANAANNIGLAQINIRALKAGMILITIVPVLLLYPLILKFFTKGTMTGALKG